VPWADEDAVFERLISAGLDFTGGQAQAGAHRGHRLGAAGQGTCEDLAHRLRWRRVPPGRSTVAKNWLVTPANWIISSGLLTMDFAAENQPPLKVPPWVKWILPSSRQKKPVCCGHSA
jgi:hypothetical protein